MKIILTGATGLIGSRFEELMFENHEITPLSSKEVDITDKSSIIEFFKEKKADAIIHLAAKTDVDGCEEDKYEDLRSLNIEEEIAKSLDINNLNVDDWKEKKTAFAVNTIGTKNLYGIAKENGLKFVYISTDFIFEGNGEYEEESTSNPINWYGMTKWYGEKLIDTSNDLIVRLSFPYGYPSPVKQDFVQKLISLLRDRDEVSLIEDQTITPTFIDDIVNGLDFLIQKNVTGIYHLVGSSFEDPYKIGQVLKEKFGFKTKINLTNRETIYAGKAPRPFKSIMKNDKIIQLGFKPKTFAEGLDLLTK